MLDLSAFQDAFVSALRGAGALEGYGDPHAVEVGLTVYRNTVAKGVLDALAANYPTVERLVGEEWFHACARLYVREQPPRVPMLVEYGEGFAEFLDQFEPAKEVPYLASVSRIDRFWTEAHLAADADILQAEFLSALAPEVLAALRLRLHPSARIGWFAEPAPTIWRLNRPPATEPEEKSADIRWAPEGVLVVRARGAVETFVLDAAGFAFLSCCQQGATLTDCARAAQSAAPDADLGALFGDFIAAGAFAAPNARQDAIAGFGRADSSVRLRRTAI